MRSIFKKLSATIAAGALAMGFAVVANAEDYGQAGILFQVRDQWDHRTKVGDDPTTETGNDALTVHFEDVNITGNGQYTVMMSKYIVPEEDIDFVTIGYLSLGWNVDMNTYPDLVFNIDEIVIDGTTYTVNEQPEVEDSETSDKCMKIKNSWGDVSADTTPAMDNSPWRTREPITITFTVSGLPEEKIADNPDELIISDFVSQWDIDNGIVDADGNILDGSGAGEAEESVEAGDSESTAETAESVEDSAEASDDVEPDTEAASEEEKKETKKDDKDDSSKDEDGLGAGVIAGICAGVVAVIAIILALVLRKKKQ
ncbi:MAG: hypothetical protein IJ746_00495 [Ruminococcus sp.]|nr:hypothetical protein [Ruminococcus sp.]